MIVNVSGRCMGMYTTKPGTDRKTGQPYPERHKLQVLCKDSTGRGEIIDVGIPDPAFGAKHVEKEIDIPVDVFARGSVVYFKAV